MYLDYIIVKIHQLFKESEKEIFAYKCYQDGACV